MHAHAHMLTLPNSHACACPQVDLNRELHDLNLFCYIIFILYLCTIYAYIFIGINACNYNNINLCIARLHYLLFLRVHVREARACGRACVRAYVLACLLVCVCVLGSSLRLRVRVQFHTRKHLFLIYYNSV